LQQILDHGIGWRLLFSLHQGLRDFAGAVDESCPTGLSVRFFRVTIPFGSGATGSSIGKTLISGCLVGNLNAEAEKIVRKRPVANRLRRA